MSATLPGGCFGRWCALLHTETCSRAQVHSHNNLSVAEALPFVACCTCLLLEHVVSSHFRRCCLLCLAASGRHAYRLCMSLCFPLLPAHGGLCVARLMLPPFAVCFRVPHVPLLIAPGGCFGRHLLLPPCACFRMP